MYWERPTELELIKAIQSRLQEMVGTESKLLIVVTCNQQGLQPLMSTGQ